MPRGSLRRPRVYSKQSRFAVALREFEEALRIYMVTSGLVASKLLEHEMLKRVAMTQRCIAEIHRYSELHAN